MLRASTLNAVTQRKIFAFMILLCTQLSGVINVDLENRNLKKPRPEAETSWDRVIIVRVFRVQVVKEFPSIYGG
jgi:hypothetical protein